jgi:very-long-chain (3R)-3-hydroxyacyl-CoA dehydratase
MSDAAASSSAAAPSPASNSLKANYLLGYNAVSMFAWLSLLWHAGLTLKVWGFEYVHPHVDVFWKVTQSLAVLEIVHSAFGRSPLSCPVCVWARCRVR